jgi:hypothetical protein
MIFTWHCKRAVESVKKTDSTLVAGWRRFLFRGLRSVTLVYASACSLSRIQPKPLLFLNDSHTHSKSKRALYCARNRARLCKEGVQINLWDRAPLRNLGLAHGPVGDCCGCGGGGGIGPAGRNRSVMDLSCGSGLMVRRLARSGQFGRVVAVDYSESMLRVRSPGRGRGAGVPRSGSMRSRTRRRARLALTVI